MNNLWKTAFTREDHIFLKDRSELKKMKNIEKLTIDSPVFDGIKISMKKSSDKMLLDCIEVAEKQTSNIDGMADLIVTILKNELELRGISKQSSSWLEDTFGGDE